MENGGGKVLSLISCVLSLVLGLMPVRSLSKTITYEEEKDPFEARGSETEKRRKTSVLHF
jgi:hypothetical protein